MQQLQKGLALETEFFLLDRLALNVPTEIVISEDAKEWGPWAKKFIDFDLLNIDSPEEEKLVEEKTIFSFKGMAEKKFSSEWESHLLVKGELCFHYPEGCIRCLTPVWQDLSIPLQLAFLDEKFEKSSLLEDQISFVFGEEEYELFYFQKKKISLKELFEELISFHRPDFVLHHEECKGLCQDCGEDLNKASCSHC